MASGRHHVYIIEMDGKLLVRPAVASVDRTGGRQLSIRNLTTYNAVIDFPAGMVQGRNRQVPIDSGDSARVSLRGRASGFFRYSVTLHGPKAILRAEGESAPGMIVDP